jgi:hypothetical protein
LPLCDKQEQQAATVEVILEPTLAEIFSSEQQAVYYIRIIIPYNLVIYFPDLHVSRLLNVISVEIFCNESTFKFNRLLLNHVILFQTSNLTTASPSGRAV